MDDHVQLTIVCLSHTCIAYTCVVVVVVVVVLVAVRDIAFLEASLDTWRYFQAVPRSKKPRVRY